MNGIEALQNGMTAGDVGRRCGIAPSLVRVLKKGDLATLQHAAELLADGEEALEHFFADFSPEDQITVRAIVFPLRQPWHEN